MINLTPIQKAKLIILYPELREYFDIQEIKDKKPADTFHAETILVSLINKIQSLKGDDGYTPVKGKDYFTQEEVATIMEKILSDATPIKGKDYFDGDNGKDGEDGKTPTEEELLDLITPLIPAPMPGKDGTNADLDATEIATRLNTLKESVDISVIKGAVGKKELLDGMALVDGRIKLVDQRWRGGGLSKVSHDSTLTGNGTASNPLGVAGGTPATGSGTSPFLTYWIGTNTVGTVSAIKFDGTNLVMPNGKYLVDAATGAISIDPNSRILDDSSGNNRINWGHGWMYSSIGNLVLNWENGLLSDNTGNFTSIDWNQRLLVDGSGSNSMDWNYRELLDYSQNISLDWGLRRLIAQDGFTIMEDWSGTSQDATLNLFTDGIVVNGNISLGSQSYKYYYNQVNVDAPDTNWSTGVVSVPSPIILSSGGLAHTVYDSGSSHNYGFALLNTSGISLLEVDGNTAEAVFGGNVGIGLTATAALTIKAGTATAGTAPIKFTAGTLLSSLELGALEFVDNGTIGHLYITRNVAGVLTRTLIV